MCINCLYYYLIFAFRIFHCLAYFFYCCAYVFHWLTYVFRPHVDLLKKSDKLLREIKHLDNQRWQVFISMKYAVCWDAANLFYEGMIK